MSANRQFDRNSLMSKAVQFANSFASEAELRSALITLLERLKGHSNVRHPHGPNEKGKDIVFNIETAFARKELVACVIKNAAIRGAVDSNRGTRTVYHQAEQCLDTPIVNALGSEEVVQQVYVITPFECDDFAVASISSLLKTTSRVRFLFGIELFDLFEQHYPEYLLFKSGLFATYVRDLESGALNSTNAVANVLVRHGVGGGADMARQVYVAPKMRLRVAVFSFAFSRPSSGQLQRLITEAELKEFVSQTKLLINGISGLSQAIRNSSVRQDFNRLAKDFRHKWAQAYENYLASCSSQGEVPIPRREAKLALVDGTKITEEFGTLTFLLQSELDRFQDNIDRANLLAISEPRDLEAVLQHSEATSYSYVAGLAARSPGLISSQRRYDLSISDSSELFDSSADFVIVAPAGFGKSSFCDRSALQDLSDLKQQSKHVVPVLIKLHSLAGKQFTSFESAFLQSEGLVNLWRTRNENGRKRRFRFYLDGLDEIPNEAEQITLMNFAAEIKRVAPETQFVTTCREHVAGTHLQSFTRLTLSEMDDAQCNQFIESWLSRDATRISHFKMQMGQVASLDQLMRVPLLATLILSVFSTTSTIPESRIRIYDMFVSLLAGGWDIAKHVQRGSLFGPQPKMIALQALAWRLQVGGRRDGSLHDFQEVIRLQLPSLLGQSEIILQEILQDGLLIQVGVSFAFAHLSFQEYLAAKNLLGPNTDKLITAMNAYLLGEVWWRDVLVFYVSLAAQPKAIEDFIRSSVQKATRKRYDAQILTRAKSLLEEIKSVYPGSAPSFSFPDVPSVFTTKLFEIDPATGKVTFPYLIKESETS